MQRWSRRGEKSHQRPKKSEKGAVQQHPCPAPESRCRGRAVFWAYGPRHIEWPLPKVICPIFWAIGRATILPDHRRWALHFLDAERHGPREIGPLACFSTPYNCAIRLMASSAMAEPCAANTSTNLRRMWAMQATRTFDSCRFSRITSVACHSEFREQKFLRNRTFMQPVAKVRIEPLVTNAAAAEFCQYGRESDFR